MKTCLVGCGGIAAVHGSVLTSGIDTEFVAAADIKPEKAQSYAENFHTKPYPSLESMLEAEKPDVLHICTPHYLHAALSARSDGDLFPGTKYQCLYGKTACDLF